MIGPNTELDRDALLARVQRIVQQFAAECGSRHVSTPIHPGARLGNDLGLGSSDRAELLLRLSSALGLRLPEKLVAEVATVDELASAVLRAWAAAEARHQAGGSANLSATFQDAHSPTRRRVGAAGLESADTLAEVLIERARLNGHQPHIYLWEEGGPDRRGQGRAQIITFAELFERAASVSRALQERGIGCGEKVAIMLPTCAEFFYSFFGVILAGAIPVPIYPPVRADRIEEYATRQVAILRNAEARLLVTFHQAEAVARLLKPQVKSLAGVVETSRLLGRPQGTDSTFPRLTTKGDIAFLQYTSGSTGDPKGVVLTHANLLANIRAMGEAIEVRPDDVGVSWLPLYHDMGLIAAWLLPLYFGLPLAVLSPLAFLRRPERWLWAMHYYRGTVSPAPNFAYELCVRKIAEPDIEGLDLSSWRVAPNGAEPVSSGTLDRFANRFGRYGFRREALIPVYGLAEGTVDVTVSPLGRGPRVDRVERAAFEREGLAVPARPEDMHPMQFVSVGRPLPGHEVRIVDATGQELGERREGHLWFRGPSATSGYYHNAEATRQILQQDGWVASGDRAYTAEGEIYITGRDKDIIIKAGRNICAHEVEDITSQLEGVRKGSVVAFGVPDAKLGTEQLVVVAEIQDDVSRVARQRLPSAINQKIAEILGIPPDVVKLLPARSIPKTSSGKLRRSETRRLYLAGALGARKPPAWWQYLKLAVAGLHDRRKVI